MTAHDRAFKAFLARLAAGLTPPECEECGGAFTHHGPAIELAALTFPGRRFCFRCLLARIEEEGLIHSTPQLILVDIKPAPRKLWTTESHAAAIASLYPVQVLFHKKGTQWR